MTLPLATIVRICFPHSILIFKKETLCLTRWSLTLLNLYVSKRYFRNHIWKIGSLQLGMHEYSTRRVWTVSNYFFELESNTRYFELFNIIRTTRIPSNCSDQMNYSDVIELFDFVELFEPDWTVRPKSDYSVLANCSNHRTIRFIMSNSLKYFSFLFIY